MPEVNRYLPEGNPYLGGTDPRRQRTANPPVEHIYVAEAQSDGGYDVTQDRRLLQYGVEDLAEVARVITRRDRNALSVSVVDLDGYRHKERLSDL